MHAFVRQARRGDDFHEPALVKETLHLLAPRGSGLYLDGTVGGGGHARALLSRCPDCRLLAVDRDPEAVEEARGALAEFGERVRFLHRRFDHAPSDAEVRDRGLDGAMLDLGVSSHHLDRDERGFAFRKRVALDMRMDPSGDLDARRLLAQTPEGRLARVFQEFGEERRARTLAREVVRRRKKAPMATSDDLVAALAAALGRAPTAREKARVFQAVRIAVNDELECLERGLPAIRDVMNEGAVLVVISYQSLEDRTVKRAFRSWSQACVCPPGIPMCACRGRALGETLTPKPVRPGDGEVQRNPRARSARLRAWRRWS